MASTSTWTPFQSFWSSPWSAQLRAACIWLKRVPGPVVPQTPDALAPTWIRPLCVQRWVAQAIAARLAHMRQYPEHTAYVYPDYSAPLLSRAACSLMTGRR